MTGTRDLRNSKDAHGQPLCLFRERLENNAYKAVDQLSGICSGILADGVVNEKEAEFFAAWVRKYAAFEPVWPFTDVLKRLDRIFADGRCDDEERAELKGVMEAICGYGDGTTAAESYSAPLPIDAPAPAPDPVVFPERVFSITGRFAFGARRQVMDAIKTRGGIPTDATPTRLTHYMVIGVFASRDWHSANYGRKIERAVELRESGSGLAILCEEHWKRFLA